MLRFALLGVCALALNGQQLVTLADGRAAEGRVELRGPLPRLVTVFGDLRLSREAALAAQDSSVALQAVQERAALIPKGFAAGHAALARWCAERGFFAAAREHMELALAIKTDHIAVQQAAQLLAERFGPIWLADIRRDDLAETLLLQRAVLSRAHACIAIAACVHLKPEELFRPALRALKLDQPHARWAAAQVLSQLRSEPLRIKPLFTASLADETPAVRREATRALAVTADPVFVKLYAKNLIHPEPTVRVRAAEALAELNMPEATAPLLAALEDSWRPARANFTSVLQTTYVRDYDVEVAQGAVIADPVIDVVQSGVVLDVAVVSVQFERQVYRSALTRLVRRDLGDDPKAWKAALSR